ncbi:MAG: lamin tail domain-containing protein [Deltaproteobacteria bacterium]|nr:lamin tail domain-containing protein [Deltaproteobacteria bacterium]
MDRILALSTLLFLSLPACDSDDDTSDSNEADTDTDTDSDSDADADADSDSDTDSMIYKVQTGVYEPGDEVTVLGIVPVNEVGSGFFLLDGVPGPWHGIWIETGGTVKSDAERGEEFEITGEVAEIASGSGSLTAVLLTSEEDFEVKSRGNNIPLPEVIEVTAFEDDDLVEPYESTLISLKNVTITDPDLGNGEWMLNDRARVDDLYYSFGPVAQGDTIGLLIGLLYYSDGAFKVEPRNESDIRDYEPYKTECKADLCVADMSPGDLVITEIMFDPGVCTDDYCEWIEIYNATPGTVELNTLVVTDSGTDSGSIGGSVIVDPWGYAVLAISDGARWGYVDFTPDGYYGRVVLGNTGDQVTIQRPDGTLIDTAAAYVDDQTEQGVAWSLGGSPSHTANDEPSAWCAATDRIGSSKDFGSPGSPNLDCP